MTLGAKIRKFRRRLGFTQQKLADSVGVSRIYVQALESNRRTPSMKLLHRLSEALEASVTELVADNSTEPQKMHLDDLLTSGEVDVWFRKRKLSESDMKRVEGVLTAIFTEWEEEEPKKPAKGAPKKKRGPGRPRKNA